MANASRKKLSGPEAKFRPYQNWRRSPPQGLADYGNFTLIIRHDGTNLCPCGTYFHYPSTAQSPYWSRERMTAIYRHLREHELCGEFIWMMAGRTQPQGLSAELDYLRSQYAGAKIRAFVHWTPSKSYRGPVNVTRHRRHFFPRKLIKQEPPQQEEEAPEGISLQEVAQTSQTNSKTGDILASHASSSVTQAPPRPPPQLGSKENAIVIEDEDEEEEEDDDDEVEFIGFKRGSGPAGVTKPISALPLLKKEEEQDDPLALQTVDEESQLQATTSTPTNACTDTETLTQELVNRGEALALGARQQGRYARPEDPMELSVEYGEEEDAVEDDAQA